LYRDSVVVYINPVGQQSDITYCFSPDHSTLYTYSATNGRRGVVSSQTIGSADTQDFIYGYETNSNLLKTTQSFTNYNFSSKSAAGIQQVTNTYQTNRDALLTKSNTRASHNSIISAVNYTVNNIGQRTNATRSGVATNSTTWGYDALGQVSYTLCIGPYGSKVYVYGVGWFVVEDFGSGAKNKPSFMDLWLNVASIDVARLLTTEKGKACCFKKGDKIPDDLKKAGAGETWK
jgi:3D (Asp-Asp-Asp) domain-containing protein